VVKDFYIILGISPAASQDDIKRAYRRKAMELHPDHYGPDAGPFIDVQDAYAVLGDPGRRRSYDARLAAQQPGATRIPVKGERIGSRRPPAEPLIPRKPEPLEDVSLFRSFETFSPSFDEIFEHLWSNFTGATHPKSERVERLTIDVPLPYEQAVRGGRVRVLVPAVVRCPTCGGHGGVGPFECRRCRGQGDVSGDFPVSIAFPAGIPDGHVATVSLEHLGIRNLFLTVRFCVS
jgi:molecular chaperone DnaJ